jgi:protein gp37
MQKTKIDWPGLSYTWNPVTGCPRCCSYCYARRIHERFYSYPFSIITYHKSRLNDPSKLKKPSVIFVGSMSDIEYWNKDFIRLILAECENNKQHTFMFLSKSPKSYAGFNWPENTMQGLTLTKCNTVGENYWVTLLVGNCPRPFISIEPLMGMFQFNPSFQIMEKIIVGAMTGSNAVTPKQEWIDSIQKFIRGDQIYWKENIKKIGFKIGGSNYGII